MSFVSVLFFIALFAVGTVFYIVPPRWRTLYMLVLSYAFYATWNVPYLALLALASLVAYGAGRLIARCAVEKDKLRTLCAGVGVLVALMVAFKAAGQISGVLFPLGLSYYSFKLIAYMIEVYWDDATVEKDAVTFFLYPAFFSQIVSGPIQRPLAFFEQWRGQALKLADYDRIDSGYRYILGGLMMKLLLGDRLASFIQVVDADPGRYHYLIILTTVICFTLQLYADFAGYTNIAIGIGKIFGIDGPPNFNAPFRAPTIQNMWQRWHMSLTGWLTDYLFMPLQMALRGLGGMGAMLAIAVNMIVIGLWHGLTVNYLIFGVLHALFLIAVFLFPKKPLQAISRFGVGRVALTGIGIVLTFLMMTFTQIFFHTASLSHALDLLKLVFGLTPAGTLRWVDIRTEIVDPIFIVMILTAYIGAGLQFHGKIGALILTHVPRWVIYGLALTLISILSVDSDAKFIYGQF